MLLVFFGDFGLVDKVDLVIGAGDGAINWGDFSVDLGEVFLASSEESESILRQENIPGKKSLGAEIFVFK